MFKILVTGNSMYPTLKEGYVYNAEEIHPLDIKIDDIILFKKEKTNIVAHRVVKIIQTKKRKVFLTKGDNNMSNDNTIIFDGEIIGKVIQ